MHLTELPQGLLTDESTTSGRGEIQGIQRWLGIIMTFGEVDRDSVLVFDVDVGTIFREEIIAQLGYGG